MTRQPDWDLDRMRGEEGEEVVRRLRHGILVGTCEVKTDDRARETGNVYVEYECQTSEGWMPSGIATTKATTWVFVCWPVFIAAPTWLLTLVSRDIWSDERRRAECKVGSHPTRGVLLPLSELPERLIARANLPATKEAA